MYIICNTANNYIMIDTDGSSNFVYMLDVLRDVEPASKGGLPGPCGPLRCLRERTRRKWASSTVLKKTERSGGAFLAGINPSSQQRQTRAGTDPAHGSPVRRRGGLFWTRALGTSRTVRFGFRARTCTSCVSSCLCICIAYEGSLKRPKGRGWRLLAAAAATATRTTRLLSLLRGSLR
jgi:hypothetical protein